MKPTTETTDNINQRKNYWPAFFVLVGIITLFTDKAPWSWFTSSGLMLFAWFQYYYPGARASLTPKQIYQSYKSGRQRIPPAYVHAVGWLAIIMCTIGILGALGLF